MSPAQGLFANSLQKNDFAFCSLPIELEFHIKPSVFGILCFRFVERPKRDDFAPTAIVFD